MQTPLNFQTSCCNLKIRAWKQNCVTFPLFLFLKEIHKPATYIFNFSSFVKVNLQRSSFAKLHLRLIRIAGRN